MQLVIVESPTKSKTLQKFLGSKYKILSSYGHIRDLPKNNLGIDIENNFEPKYIIPVKAKQVLQALKKELKEVDSVLLATDPDREGEAIAWHLVKALDLEGKKPYKRISFHEITKPAIENAINNTTEIDKNLVDAQQARRILDRIVGYKLSPLLWKKIVKGLSAGRVQSVALRLIVEREKEIKKFTPEEYWSIIVNLEKNNQNDSPSFEAILIKENEKTISKLEIKNKEQADEILNNLKNTEYKIIDIKKEEKNRNPLPPFTTSTLQQEASKKLNFPVRFTMRTAQALYEKGLTTYHRTDSLNISNISLAETKDFIIKNYGKEYWAGFFKKYKAKGNVQEAHEAIRPTSVEQTPDKAKIQKKLDSAQFKLYNLIWRRFLASQMSQAIFDSTTLDIETSEKKYIFRSSGQTLKFDGFLKIYTKKYKENELPELNKDEILKFIEIISSQHFTQPPARFSEATLIKELEKNGIGRPSTYASILTTIQQRNYTQKNEQKKFQPTEIGTIVSDFLVEHFSRIVDIKFTAIMEENLDKIAQGETTLLKVLQDFYSSFEKNLKEKEENVPKKDLIKKTNMKCPKCNSELIIRLGKFGKFYACSNFPECKYTQALKKSNLGIKCPECKEGDIVEKKTKRGKIFYACNQFPTCDFALWDKPIKEKCPECNSLLIKTKKEEIKCSNKNCDFEKENIDTNLKT